jgi:CBS domain containing-hemolysin-like protein
MVPRGEVVFLDVNLPVPENLMMTRKTQHTRYPLCDGSFDEILGVVHVKDLVGRKIVDLRSVMRPAQHVPETKRIDRLLAEMRKSRQHMAVVVDEHGSSVGIVTLENILEEIVGSVQDEFDRETPDVFRDKEGSYIALGGLSLERLRSQFDLPLAASEVNTLSGLLAAELGRFPKEGDRVTLPGVVAEVLEADGSRAQKVRLTFLPRPGEEEEVDL